MLKPITRVSADDLALYRARFVNRDDVYARQWEDGQGWVRVAAPLTDSVLRAHLRGVITIGVYTPDLNGQTRWVCVDFDTEDGQERGRRLQTRLAEGGVSCLIELSAHGRCHVWTLFATPTPAAPVRQAALALVADLGWPAEPGVVEVFPKHDRVESGAFGALMRGPLGRHRKVGGEIFPLVRLDSATGQREEGGLDVLRRASLANPEALLRTAPVLRVPADPAPTPRSTRDESVSPLTRAIYERVSVRALLAEQGIPVNRSGKARCPFHDDKNPSLQDYGVRFYCFGCGARGDVITLYERLQRLPNRWRAREELAEKLGLEPDERRRAGRAEPAVRREPRVIQLSLFKDLKDATRTAS